MSSMFQYHVSLNIVCFYQPNELITTVTYWLLCDLKVILGKHSSLVGCEWFPLWEDRTAFRTSGTAAVSAMWHHIWSDLIPQLHHLRSHKVLLVCVLSFEMLQDMMWLNVLCCVALLLLPSSVVM